MVRNNFNHERDGPASTSHSTSSKNAEIPPMNEVVVRSLIYQKLNEIRSGELYVAHDLQDDSVDELLHDSTTYKKFESIIGKTWMHVDMISNNESGLNGGKLNRKKKMYTKALKVASGFVKEQIEAYIMQRDGDLPVDVADGENDADADGELANDDHDHAGEVVHDGGHSHSHYSEAEEDTVSSLSDSKISRSSASQKRKKKKKSKKKKHKDKKKSKKRKKRHSYESDTDLDDDRGGDQDHAGGDFDDDGDIDMDADHDVDVDADPDDDGEESDSGPPLTKREEARLRRRIEKAKVVFEKERTDIIKRIPKNVKNDFRKLGFAKWGTDVLPCMQLGPYEVGPGGVRDQWMKMFNNTLRSKRPLTRLIFWYGTPKEDLSNSFSFLPQSKVTSWEEGCIKGFHITPAKINRKMENSKKLTHNETTLVNGLDQIMEDSKLDPADRSPWLFEFEEDFEDYFDQIDDETSDEEEEEHIMEDNHDQNQRKKKKKGQKIKKQVKERDGSSKKKKKKKKSQTEVEISEKDSIDSSARSDSSRRKKKEKKQKSVKKKTESEKEREKKKRKRKVDEDLFEDEVEAEIEIPKKKSKSIILDEEIRQEVAEEDAVMEMDAPSDNDEHDDDFDDAISESDEELYQDDVEEVVKKVAPKKSVSSSKSKEKKQILKSSQDLEQELFEECEKIFLPIMAKLSDSKDENSAAKYLRKIDRDVQRLTPSFFRTHQIGLVVKGARSRFKESAQLNQLCKRVTSKMKRVFHDKLPSEPKGFQPKVKKISKKKSVKKKTKAEVKQEQSSPLTPSLTPSLDSKETRILQTRKKIDKVPRSADDVNTDSEIPKMLSHEKTAGEQKVITKTPKPLKSKAPRKSFSLAGMIDRKPSTNNASASTVSIEKEDTPTEVKGKQEQPQWTVNYISSTSNSYESSSERVFAMRFLTDAVAILPKGKVDPTSISLALEEALYAKYENDTDRYIEHVHGISAAIAGKKQIGSLAQQIIAGNYATPLDVINIPPKMLYNSFKGFWIS